MNNPQMATDFPIMLFIFEWLMEDEEALIRRISNSFRRASNAKGNHEHHTEVFSNFRVGRGIVCSTFVGQLDDTRC